MKTASWLPATLLLACSAAHSAHAQPKPILDGFTADPAIRVFGGIYYLYPTSDKPNWLTTDFSVWSSGSVGEPIVHGHGQP